MTTTVIPVLGGEFRKGNITITKNAASNPVVSVEIQPATKEEFNEYQKAKNPSK